MTKQELKKEFEEVYFEDRIGLVDFFWAEIESLQKQVKTFEEKELHWQVSTDYLHEDISRLTALLKAADEVIEQVGNEPTMSGLILKPRKGYRAFNEVMEKYLTLKAMKEN